MSTADGRGGPGSNQHATKPPLEPRDATGGGADPAAGAAVATADPMAEPAHVAAARDRHDPAAQQRYEDVVDEVGHDLGELEDAQTTWESRVTYAKATREALIDDLDEHGASETDKATVLSALDDVGPSDDEKHVRARLLEAGQYRTGTVERAVDAVNARKAELAGRAEVQERHDGIANRIMRAGRARGAASDAAFRTAEDTLREDGGDRRTVVRDVTETLGSDMHDTDDRLRDLAGRVNELRLRSGRDGRNWPIV